MYFSMYFYTILGGKYSDFFFKKENWFISVFFVFQKSSANF